MPAKPALSTGFHRKCMVNSRGYHSQIVVNWYTTVAQRPSNANVVQFCVDIAGLLSSLSGLASGNLLHRTVHILITKLAREVMLGLGTALAIVPTFAGNRGGRGDGVLHSTT